MTKIIFSFLLYASLFSTNSSLAMADIENQTKEIFPPLREIEQTSELRPHVGVLGGISAPTQKGYDASANYGLSAGFQPLIPIGVGFELSRNSSDMALPNGTIETAQRTKALLKSSYNFGGTTPIVKSSYVALGLGPVFESIGNNSFTKLGIMPHLGFDLTIERPFSLGLAANYLFIPGDEANSWGINSELKYWF